MSLAAIALGSNLESSFGGRNKNLCEAVKRVETLGHVVAVSSFWDTAPVGNLQQGRFLNGALLLETERGPLDLMLGLLETERGMGRDRSATAAKGPRVIDLDLLLYDKVVMETKQLTLPHPAMRERGFVLGPLAEIAATWVDPVTGLTVAELLARLGPE